MAPAATPPPSRWGKPHNNALKALFHTKKADPQRQETPYIDRIYNNLPVGSVLRMVPEIRFRTHYREKAATWMTEQALTGIRRSE